MKVIRITLASLYVVLALGCSVLALGCSGDDPADQGASPRDLGPVDLGSDTPDQGGPEPDPLYILGGATPTPDGLVGYVFVSDSIGSDVEVDLANSLEIPGVGAILVSNPPDGAFFAASMAAPTLQRYDVDDEGAITAGETVSFAGLGLNGQGSSFAIVSATKAYVFDWQLLLAVEFNPTTMEIVTSFELDGLDAGENLTPEIGRMIENGGRWVANVRYFEDGGPQSAVETRLLVLDPSDNSVTYDTQTDCGNLLWAVETDAAIYYTPHANQPVFEFLEIDDHAPCAKRVLRGAAEFDDGYVLDLNATFGGLTAPSTSGPGSVGYVLTYDEDIGGPVNERTAFTAGWVAAAYDFDGATVLGEVADLPPGGGAALSAFSVTVEGEQRFLLGAVAADFSSTVFYDISDPQQAEEAFTVPGFGGLIARVR